MSRPKRTCTVADCGAEHSGHGFCRKHLYRWQKHGSPHKRLNSEGPSAEVTGYLVRRAPGHPLATKHGHLREHRRVLYDTIGPGWHSCHWCFKPVGWGVNLHVDHLDGNRANNDPSNLVPSCRACNGKRRREPWTIGQQVGTSQV